MTDEEMKALVRSIKAGLAEDFDRVHRAIERLEVKLMHLEQRLAGFESEVRSRLTALEMR